MRKVLFTLVCALAALAALAVPPSTARAEPRDDLAGIVSPLVSGQLDENKIPGASVVVVKDGRTVFSKGYGVADVKARTPVEPERTAFFTGSMAKAFTATAVMQLVHDGRLGLDEDVNRYLTTFKIKDTYPGKPVTLRHLLTYTAGFDENMIGVAERDPEDVVPLGEGVEERQPERVRPPGTRVAYDNYGVALAGYVVEVVSKQPFAKYVDEHIVRPLRMSGTSFAVPTPQHIEKRLAEGYRPSGDGFTADSGQYGPWTPSGTGPVTTPADMGTFMIAQLAGSEAIGGPDVTEPLRARHHTHDDRMPGMGLTFEERPRNGHPRWYKDGDVPGFHSVMALLPEQNAGVYVVYNGDGAEGNATFLGQQVMDAVTDHYAPAASRLTGKPAGLGGDVAEYEGTYRSNRTSNSDLTRFNSLMTGITVTAGENGTLTTSGISLDPDKTTQHWVQTQPGLFTEKDGQGRIAFVGKTLVTTANPADSYDRLAWYDEPSLHLGLLVAGAAAFLIAFFAFPVVAVVRGVRHRPVHPLPARLTRTAAWLAAALVTAFLTGMSLVMSDGNAIMEMVPLGSPELTALPYIATASFIAAIPLAVAVVAAWWKGWWGRTGRISLTLLVLASVPFYKLCITYHLLALPFPTA
ncbi:class A beta-lactamase-related serine hydrolase [Actinomadura sp. KC345]|uniref:serine hydrolase domain-containing protein n=1 Tax=Actinomadura sp. KC345 TaxID=2530371 RepID=UPI00104CAD16|nr:serine hydrolase domain-containing protein [Actinomadura sp. KC345]TDC54457.1 class A beta-lactamase-related serine hydrolase [Actinomadura sp. KC345]